LYKYKNKIDMGYKQIFLSRKNHNELFSKRRIKFFQKYEYYIQDNSFIMERYINIFGKVIMTFLFPVTVFLSLKDIKKITREYAGLLKQKKYGSFVSDSVNSIETIEKILLTKKE